MQKDFQKKHYKENTGIRIEYQKKGANKMLKLIKKKILKTGISRK